MFLKIPIKYLLLFVCGFILCFSDAQAVSYGFRFDSKTKTAILTDGSEATGNITIPPSVNYGGVTYQITEIGEGAFKGTSITSITLPNTITTIQIRAFYECVKLSTITIPSSVTKIGREAWGFCRAVTSVHISDIAAWCNIDFEDAWSNPLWNNSDNNKLYLNGQVVKELKIPNSVVKVNKFAFMGCASLTSIILPKSVIRVGHSAFNGCKNVTLISIPSSVTMIEDYAFSANTQLKDVYCYRTTPPVLQTTHWSSNEMPFSDSNYIHVTLHVPASSINTYNSTEPWKYFGSIVAAGNEPGDNVTLVSSISLSPSSIELDPDKTIQITPTIYPSNATNKGVKWSTSNSEIASVSSTGLVKSGKEGTAVITCTAEDGSGVKATCNVTVRNSSLDPTSISLPDYVTLNIGESKLISYTLTPSYATTTVTWTSDDPSIATVSSGIIKGLKAGTTKIRVTTANGKTDYCYVEVVNNSGSNSGDDTWSQADENWGLQGQKTLDVNDSYKVSLPITEESVPLVTESRWSTKGSSNITITDKGKVACLIKTLKTGSCRLYFYFGTTYGTTYEGYYEYTVVGNSDVKVTSITLNATSANLTVNETKQLTATVSPSNATNKNVTWTSSNTSVATVSSTGLVTAVAAGTATITCTAADGSGKSATCKITVQNKLDNMSVMTSSAGYATFYSSETAYTLPSHLSAQVVTNCYDNKLTFNTIADGNNGGVIPKGTAVMLVNDMKSSASFTLVPSTSTTQYTGTNYLHGSDVATTTSASGTNYYYKLTYGDAGSEYSNIFGWYWGASNGAPFFIEGHKAWLALPTSAVKRSAFFVGDVSGINDLTIGEEEGDGLYYDMLGRPVKEPNASGIYIKNGKKVLIMK